MHAIVCALLGGENSVAIDIIAKHVEKRLKEVSQKLQQQLGYLSPFHCPQSIAILNYVYFFGSTLTDYVLNRPMGCTTPSVKTVWRITATALVAAVQLVTTAPIATPTHPPVERQMIDPATATSPPGVTPPTPRCCRPTLTSFHSLLRPIVCTPCCVIRTLTRTPSYSTPRG